MPVAICSPCTDKSGPLSVVMWKKPSKTSVWNLFGASYAGVSFLSKHGAALPEIMEKKHVAVVRKFSKTNAFFALRPILNAFCSGC